ncbi:MAG: PadR family transcriptional regulator [Candidatus Thorarchaeota archaeon]
MPKTVKTDELEFVVLGILNHEPMTGYDIKERIEREVGYFWPEVDYNKIYPTLKKIEKKNLATMKIDDKNYPPKKIYTLTDTGYNYFMKWLSQPVKMTKHGFTYFQEFLLKIHFGGELPDEILLRNIDAFEQWLNKILAVFIGYEGNLNSVINEDKDHRNYLLSLLFGKAIYTSLFDWIDEAKKIIKK